MTEGEILTGLRRMVRNVAIEMKISEARVRDLLISILRRMS